VTRKKALLALERMTQERLLSIVESFLTSRQQYEALLWSALSEHKSTRGMGGVTSLTDEIGTLMACYDTWTTKQKERFWMLSLDFITISTPLGTPSRGPSFE
jgi:hypothetical protein